MKNFSVKTILAAYTAVLLLFFIKPGFIVITLYIAVTGLSFFIINEQAMVLIANAFSFKRLHSSLMSLFASYQQSLLKRNTRRKKSVYAF